MSVDLQLVAMDDLMKEVGSRCQDFVFYGRRQIGVNDDGDPVYTYRCRQKGTYEATIFLSTMLTHELSNSLMEDWEDPEPWEEF